MKTSAAPKIPPSTCDEVVIPVSQRVPQENNLRGARSLWRVGKKPSPQARERHEKKAYHSRSRRTRVWLHARKPKLWSKAAIVVNSDQKRNSLFGDLAVLAPPKSEL